MRPHNQIYFRAVFEFTQFAQPTHWYRCRKCGEKIWSNLYPSDDWELEKKLEFHQLESPSCFPLTIVYDEQPA